MRWILVLAVATGCSLDWGRRGDQALDAGAGAPDAQMADATIDAAVDAPTPGADLAVSLARTPIHVAATAPFTYRATVANAGPFEATELTLALQLPSGSSSITTDGLMCGVIGMTVTCSVATLAVGASVIVDISARAPGALGVIAFSASATAATFDPVAENNTANAASVIGSSGGFAAQVAYATGVEPIAVTTADFNGDGRADVATVNHNHQGSNINNPGSVSVLLAGTNGTLNAASSYGVGYGPQAVIAGNFDGGSLDLVTPNLAAGMGGNATIVFGSGGGMFTTAVPFSACCSPQHLAAGDLDGNGTLDLVVANYFKVQVILGAGTGSFAAPVDVTLPGPALSVAIGDMNNDGKLDVVAGYSIYMQANNIAVLLGNGNGTLQDPVLADTTKGTVRAVLGDVNKDGKLDVVTANNNTNDISILLGSGTGALAAPVHYPMGRVPTGIVVEDFNGDGKPDVAVSNGDDSTVSVRLGNGNGTFQTFATYATGSVPLSIAAGDVDADGRPDLIVTNGAANSVSVLRALP